MTTNFFVAICFTNLVCYLTSRSLITIHPVFLEVDFKDGNAIYNLPETFFSRNVILMYKVGLGKTPNVERSVKSAMPVSFFEIRIT